MVQRTQFTFVVCEMSKTGVEMRSVEQYSSWGCSSFSIYPWDFASDFVLNLTSGVCVEI